MRYVLSQCRCAGRSLWRGHGVIVEQSCERFPKTLFVLSRCRISKAIGFRDMLSQSQMHINARDGVDYGGGTTKRMRQNLDVLCFADRRCVWRQWPIAIYRETPVQLGLYHSNNS